MDSVSGVINRFHLQLGGALEKSERERERETAILGDNCKIDAKSLASFLSLLHKCGSYIEQYDPCHFSGQF